MENEKVHGRRQKSRKPRRRPEGKQASEQQPDRGKNRFQKRRPPHFQPVDFGSSVCPICGAEIDSIASALNDPATASPVHFDCALKKVAEQERPASDESVAYIGKGRFGIIRYPNPHDQIHFEIKRIVEWEGENAEWRKKAGEKFDAAVIPDSVRFDTIR